MIKKSNNFTIFSFHLFILFFSLLSFFVLVSPYITICSSSLLINTNINTNINVHIQIQFQIYFSASLSSSQNLPINSFILFIPVYQMSTLSHLTFLSNFSKLECFYIFLFLFLYFFYIFMFLLFNYFCFHSYFHYYNSFFLSLLFSYSSHSNFLSILIYLRSQIISDVTHRVDSILYNNRDVRAHGKGDSGAERCCLEWG